MPDKSEWPKTWGRKWETSYGTAELSMSFDPTWWSREKEKKPEKEEELEDWEVIDTPPQEEMKRFHGTGPPPKKDDKLERKDLPAPAQNKDENVDPSTSIAERRGQKLPAIPSLSESTKDEAKKHELHPCKRCESYHYIDKCVYEFPEDQWLEYHNTYMGSQPLSPPETGEGARRKRMQIRMTEPGRKMLADDTAWREKRMLERGRAVRKDSSGELLRGQWERAEKEAGMGDEADEEDVDDGSGKGAAEAPKFVLAARPHSALLD